MSTLSSWPGSTSTNTCRDRHIEHERRERFTATNGFSCVCPHSRRDERTTPVAREQRFRSISWLDRESKGVSTQITPFARGDMFHGEQHDLSLLCVQGRDQCQQWSGCHPQCCRHDGSGTAHGRRGRDITREPDDWTRIEGGSRDRTNSHEDRRECHACFSS